MRRRGLEPPPGYPGPGPQPDSGGVLSVQTALDRHIPSAGEDGADGEDDADVPKSVLTNPPQPARSRLGDLPDPRARQLDRRGDPMRATSQSTSMIRGSRLTLSEGSSAKSSVIC